MERDNHHLMSEAALHSVYPEHRRIRDNPSMQTALYRAVHNLLHKDEAHVPLLSRYTAAKVGVQLPKDLHVLDAIDEYSRLVDADRHAPRIKPIEVLQNELSVEAVRAQIPYIKDDMSKLIIDMGR